VAIAQVDSGHERHTSRVAAISVRNASSPRSTEAARLERGEKCESESFGEFQHSSLSCVDFLVCGIGDGRARGMGAAGADSNRL